MNKKLWAIAAVLLLVPGCGVGCVSVGVLGLLAMSGGVQSQEIKRTLSSEERVWDAFADFIESHPERFADTDRVYKIGEELKKLGRVSSTARLSEYAAKMQEIDSSNVEDVARTVRGN